MTATAGAGELTLVVWRTGITRERRTRYGYRIIERRWEHVGDDLETGVGFDHGETYMVGALAGFLGAAAESYPDGEHADLFPPHVVEAAHQNSDELSMLALELEVADS